MMHTARKLLSTSLRSQNKHAMRAACSTPTKRIQRRRVVDESTLAGAQHKMSLSGPSLGHLVSELSATRPGMERLRREGQTMSEEHRTQVRQVAKWIIGVPFTIGTVLVGSNWMLS